jgi:hypothetical protein
MLFRLACFIAIFFVPGVWRWVLGAGAVFLPYIAVILANQADTRGRRGPKPADDDPEPATDHLQLESVVVIEPDEAVEAREPTESQEHRDRRERDDAA